MAHLLDRFKELEDHAREWLEFSRETYGWETREYDEYVRCYFAENSDHQSVRLGKYGCDINVSFFSPVQFSGMTYKALTSLDSILADCRALLVVERQKANERSEAEVETHRAQQIEKLRMRLAELEGGVAA